VTSDPPVSALAVPYAARYNSRVRRVSLWILGIASVVFGVLAVLMALLEVVHLAHGEFEHFAGTFAAQALVVPGVLTAGAVVVARHGEDVQSG